MIYKTQPEGFQPEFIVVGILIEFNKEIVLLRRHEGKSYPGCYGTPGGKMEPKDNNDRIVATWREALEETGIDLDKDSIESLEEYYVSHRGKNFIYMHHRIVLDKKPDEIKISLAEHDVYIWATPEEALTLPLVEDEDFVIKEAYQIA